MNLEKLCLDIARTEDADDVIKILKGNSLWENLENWKIINPSGVTGRDFK